MRKICILLVFIAAIFCSCSKDLQIKVISFNIRYDNPSDGANAWPNRKEIAAGFLEEQAPDIFGLQEALWHQYTYLDSCLTGYASVGAGRDDGDKKGEMNPVFYSVDRFDLLVSNTFWLSETPGIPGSKGWGAVLPRIVTWVKLEEIGSGDQFYLFNTHFSHMSDSARIMSSKILEEEVRSISGDNFFIITGDFNMTPESRAYSVMTGDSKEGLIRDTFVESLTDPIGPDYTFNGFNDKPGEGRIDYIFARSGVAVSSHETIYLKEGNIFISDHWPVRSTLIWSRD